jgi:hypothetical protein
MDAFDVLESATVIETAQVPETSDDLAAVRDMFKSAPPMDGPRVTTGLEPGTPAPDFALPAADGTIVRLSEMRGTPVAVVFYPLDWSPGCGVQLELYQQEHNEFASRGIRLLGISVDSIYSHGAWAAVRGIRYPLSPSRRWEGSTPSTSARTRSTACLTWAVEPVACSHRRHSVALACGQAPRSRAVVMLEGEP